jgi:replicative DNA helicase
MWSDVLPVDQDSERALLGALLSGVAEYQHIATLVSAEDFSVESHRRIWGAIAGLWNVGASVDRVTVATHLRDKGHLDSVGGISGIAGLEDGLGQVFGAETYARTVRDKSVLRRTMFACRSLYSQCVENQNSREVLAAGEKMLREIGASVSQDRRLVNAGEVIASAGGIDAFMSGTKASVEIPWQGMNTVLGGGFRNGELILLAASTSVGKTAAASQIALYAASRGIGVAMFSLEMQKRDMLMRMAIMRSGVDGNHVRFNRLSREESRKYVTALSELNELPLYFDDSASCSIPAIHAAVRSKRAEAPIGLIVVDYLQLLETVGKRPDTRAVEVGAFSRGLKLMAGDFDIPVVALSQLNRAAEDRAEPELRDLRESGSLEHDANTVLFLHRKDQQAAMYSDVIPVRMLCKKQRNGPLGYADLQYHKRFLRFEESSEGM